MILFREELILQKKSYMFNKTLVIGIIFLLIGVNASAILVNSIDGESGISLITIKVTGGYSENNDWYGNDNRFNFSYESDEIVDIYYGIDGNFSLYNESFTVQEGGEHILEWYAVNHTGNKSIIDDPFYFNVDKTPPWASITYEIIGGNPYQGWIFEFTTTATDALSGMDHVEFYMSYEVQDTVYGSGPEYVWRIRYWPLPKVIFGAIAYDKAGNTEWDEIIEPCIIDVLKSHIIKTDIDEEKSNNYSIDNSIPSQNTKRKNIRNIDKIPSGNHNREVFDPAYVLIEFNRDYCKNDWIVDDVYIPIFYESDRIDEVYYQINNSGWLLYHSPIKISRDGTYDLSWYVIDSEGNSSKPDSIPTFKVDLTPPIIDLKQERLANNMVKFTAEVNDETSGIEKVKFQGRYEGFIDNDYPYEFIWYGFLKDTITVTVYDNAGNTNTQSMVTSRNNIQNHQTLNLMFYRFLERFTFIEKIISLIM
jgi:hypothetical protein